MNNVHCYCCYYTIQYRHNIDHKKPRSHKRRGPGAEERGKKRRRSYIIKEEERRRRKEEEEVNTKKTPKKKNPHTHEKSPVTYTLFFFFSQSVTDDLSPTDTLQLYINCSWLFPISFLELKLRARKKATVEFQITALIRDRLKKNECSRLVAA